jgi:DNA-binding response OmpR family regulator
MQRDETPDPQRPLHRLRDPLIEAVRAKSRNLRRGCESPVTTAGERVAASQPPVRLTATMNRTSAVAPDRPLGDSNPQGARSAPLRLAVIDGDSGFLHVLEKRVRARGWQQRVLAGAVPIEELVALRLGALVIDLSVLGAPGWTYLEQVCSALPALPVIVCTGPSTVAQRVRALRLGADDWLAKPCHPEELIARIEAIVRRGRVAAPPAERPALEAGELSIRSDQFQAFVGTRSLDLTRREFELIRLLAGNAGHVLEREAIYQRVWGYAMAHGDRSVDVFVRKLRQKLERTSPGWRYIHTHFGVGYRFAPERVDEEGSEPVSPMSGELAAGELTPEHLLQ